MIFVIFKIAIQVRQ